MICKNCGYEFNNKFCGNCGQKNIEGRITVREVMHNFFHSFTHLDRGILFLIKELFFRPGIVAKEYLAGKRKKYFNPLQFLVIVVAAATFLSFNLSLFGTKADLSNMEQFNEQVRFGLQFNNFIYKYFNVIVFVSVPVLAFYTRLIFKKTGYNYAEVFIFTAFIAGERGIFYILLSPLLHYFTSHNLYFAGIGIYYFIVVVYFSFAYVQFFGGKKIFTILKFLAAFLLMTATAQALAMLTFRLFFYH